MWENKSVPFGPVGADLLLDSCEIAGMRSARGTETYLVLFKVP